MSRRRGFSLVELSVAAGIGILVLAAMYGAQSGSPRHRAPDGSPPAGPIRSSTGPARLRWVIAARWMKIIQALAALRGRSAGRIVD